MEIKYTIEILTKDIQDIEKLVGNLRNSEEDSSIDLDLALSKLRHVYEILTMIKTDRLRELIREEKNLTGLPAESEAKPPEPEAKPDLETPVEPRTEPEPVSKSIPDPVPPAAPSPQTEPVAKSKPEAADPSILAEKFSAESSINENLGGKHGHDIESKLVGQPIDNISRNIGINDRFFIIRELFEGDADQFRELVDRLDSAENYEEAKGMMETQFLENKDHEGIKILEGLVKRRHIR